MECNAKGVIFDLDGVLTDTAHFHFIAWSELANSLGIAIDKEFNESLKGIDRMSSLELILQHGKVSLSKDEKERYAAIKNEHYRSLIKEMSPDDVLPGVVARLEELKSLDKKVALASTSKNATTILRAIGLEPYFDSIADVNKVGHNKPAPDIFLLAAKELDLNPKDCIGVEDAVAGIKAIKAANMLAIGIGDPKVLVGADYVYPDMAAFSFLRFTHR